jgi:hypothetical protein
MHINKTKINDSIPYFNYGYRWDCTPKVSEPSVKGPLYWNPPSFIPTIYKAKALGDTKTPGTNILSQSTIEHCMKKYTYLWLSNHTEFWSVPILCRNSYIYVWIWNNVKWTYYIMSLENIDCFICYWHTSLALNRKITKREYKQRIIITLASITQNHWFHMYWH